MSVDSLINEFERDSSISIEQIASALLTKDNLPLKTEIPFATEVEVTALLKDVCFFIGDLFNDVEITDGNGGMEKYTVSIKNEKGETSKVSIGAVITARLLQGIGFSEEYAVSHNRKGRIEVKDMISRKIEEQKTVKQDSLSRLSNQVQR